MYQPLPSDQPMSAAERRSRLVPVEPRRSSLYPVKRHSIKAPVERRSMLINNDVNASNVSARLVGGNASNDLYSGRLEVYLAAESNSTTSTNSTNSTWGTWGTVCDDAFSTSVGRCSRAG